MCLFLKDVCIDVNSEKTLFVLSFYEGKLVESKASLKYSCC